MTREPLSAEDARILGLERGHVRGHVLKVMTVEGAVGPDALRQRVGERIGREPVLTSILDPEPPPAWVDAPDFKLEEHVVGAVCTTLPELAARRMEERLDRSRPLWSLDVAPLPGGRTALLLRLHHALADGMTAMRLLETLLFDPHPEEPAPPATRARPAPRRAPALRVPSALLRELAGRGRPTPLDRPAGEHRQVAFVDADLDRLRQIGHAAGATVNDVVLAAVAGGLRAWMGEAAGVRAKVPVSLHSAAGHAANRDSFLVVDLPLHEPDPARRLRAVARDTRQRKAARDAETVDHFFADLSHLSPSFERLAQAWALSPRVFTLNVSNVPGPRAQRAVLGAPVRRLCSLAEVANKHALRISVVSGCGRLTFGLCADPEAVGPVEPLAQAIEGELDALAA
jgi:diacylglycerol O-acyltransferase